MTSAYWFVLIGGLLLFMGITSSALQRWPVTTAILYLLTGFLVGPSVLNLFHFNPLKESMFLEKITEIALLISLFSAGVKMPVPVRLARWRAPIMLASVSMLISVSLIAAFLYFVFDMPIGVSILLGAIVAPTDPVLATDVQSRHPGDSDQLRFTLTSEAGMNDGSAFPFVVLGLGLLGIHEIGPFGMRWVLVDVLWATTAGILIGCSIGYGFGRFISLLHRKYQHKLLDDFLGLGLIGVVYGVSELTSAWGFLAVFFAAVALRQAEFRSATPDKESRDSLPSNQNESSEDVPKISSGALIFNEYLERLSELVLILLVGGTLFLNSWS